MSFIDAHVDRSERMNGFGSRLTAGMWGGSFANKLEIVRNQLQQLLELTRNSHVHRWIDSKVTGMEQQFTEERRRDANRGASNRA